jgi:hypothetical protein
VVNGNEYLTVVRRGIRAQVTCDGCGERRFAGFSEGSFGKTSCCFLALR